MSHFVELHQYTSEVQNTEQQCHTETNFDRFSMAGKTDGSCAFDKLFPKSVPHVLEKIFLSHDYTSFKNCLDVNNTWNMLLTSVSFCKKAKVVFQKGINNDANKLWLASQRGCAEEVRSLISSGMVDTNTICRMYISTPLCEAARNDHTNVVQVLLDNGAEPNRANIYGTTPLHEATCNKN